MQNADGTEGFKKWRTRNCLKFLAQDIFLYIATTWRSYERPAFRYNPKSLSRLVKEIIHKIRSKGGVGVSPGPIDSSCWLWRIGGSVVVSLTTQRMRNPSKEERRWMGSEVNGDVMESTTSEWRVCRELVNIGENWREQDRNGLNRDHRRVWRQTFPKADNMAGKLS